MRIFLSRRERPDLVGSTATWVPADCPPFFHESAICSVISVPVSRGSPSRPKNGRSWGYRRRLNKWTSCRRNPQRSQRSTKVCSCTMEDVGTYSNIKDLRRNEVRKHGMLREQYHMHPHLGVAGKWNTAAARTQWNCLSIAEEFCELSQYTANTTLTTPSSG